MKAHWSYKDFFAGCVFNFLKKKCVECAIHNEVAISFIEWMQWKFHFQTESFENCHVFWTIDSFSEKSWIAIWLHFCVHASSILKLKLLRKEEKNHFLIKYLLQFQFTVMKKIIKIYRAHIDAFNLFFMKKGNKTWSFHWFHQKWLEKLFIRTYNI